jgi:hypothetical protein
VSPLSDYLGLLVDVTPPPVTTPPDRPTEPRIMATPHARAITGSESAPVPGAPSRRIT